MLIYVDNFLQYSSTVHTRREQIQYEYIRVQKISLEYNNTCEFPQMGQSLKQMIQHTFPTTKTITVQIFAETREKHKLNFKFVEFRG